MRQLTTLEALEALHQPHGSQLPALTGGALACQPRDWGSPQYAQALFPECRGSSPSILLVIRGTTGDGEALAPEPEIQIPGHRLHPTASRSPALPCLGSNTEVRRLAQDRLPALQGHRSQTPFSTEPPGPPALGGCPRAHKVWLECQRKQGIPEALQDRAKAPKF